MCSPPLSRKALFLLSGEHATATNSRRHQDSCKKLNWTSEQFDHTPYDTDPCCTPKGVRCKWGRHHTEFKKSTIPDCERKNLVSILKWFKKVMTTGEWFVSDGTLLGAVRGGGFIPEDTDIDLFVDAAHADVVQTELKAAVGCTHFSFQHDHRPWQISFSKKNKVRTCIRNQHRCNCMRKWQCCNVHEHVRASVVCMSVGCVANSAVGLGFCVDRGTQTFT